MMVSNRSYLHLTCWSCCDYTQVHNVNMIRVLHIYFFHVSSNTRWNVTDLHKINCNAKFYNIIEILSVPLNLVYLMVRIPSHYLILRFNTCLCLGELTLHHALSTVIRGDTRPSVCLSALGDDCASHPRRRRGHNNGSPITFLFNGVRGRMLCQPHVTND